MKQTKERKKTLMVSLIHLLLWFLSASSSSFDSSLDWNLFKNFIHVSLCTFWRMLAEHSNLYTWINIALTAALDTGGLAEIGQNTVDCTSVQHTYINQLKLKLYGAPSRTQQNRAILFNRSIPERSQQNRRNIYGCNPQYISHNNWCAKLGPLEKKHVFLTG